MKKTLLASLLATGLLCGATVAQAAPATFVTGSGYFTTLGLELGYPSDYDHLTVTGLSGTIPASGDYTLASLLFSAGYNAWNIHNDAGNISFDFAINGTSGTLTLPYTINISYQDTLNLGSGTLNLTSGAYNYSVTTAPVVFSNAGAGVSLANNLHALISVSAVPEPETYAMLLAGLGMMGAMARRKSRKSI